MTIALGYLDPKDGIYKFYDYPINNLGPTCLSYLIAQTNNRSQIWHEKIRHLKF